MQTTMSLLDAALYYATELNWAVFPLSPRSKKPVAGSRGLKDATKEIEKIRAWWTENPNYNVGVRTGEASGIVVMDIDPRNGGDITLHELEKKYGEVPHTPRLLTGGGGEHILFKYPGWKVKSMSNVFEGIDSKGDGGYIVVSPSINEHGQEYHEDLGHPLSLALANIPTFFAEKIRAREEVTGVRKVIDKKFPKEKYLNGEVIREGGRDDTLYRMGCSMRSLGLERDEIVSLLGEVNETRCDPPFALKDIERISDSASKFEPGIVVPIDFGKEKVDFSVDGLEIPDHYQLDWDGIYHTSYQNETPSTKKIFSVPVEITRRLKNVDTGVEKIEISFYRDNAWIPMIVQRSVAFNNTKIIELADRGLPVSSANAKALVKYLTDFESANLDKKAQLSVSRMGWVGKDKFLPGLDEDILLDALDSFTKGYVCLGGVAEWVTNVSPILQFPVARFILASSFASPLLKILKVRSFVVYVYGPSGGGKSTAVKAGISAWGNPSDTLVTFADTVVSIERRAAFLRNVPLGLDELQSVRDQKQAEQLIYMLANGKSKGKGTRDGVGIQDQVTWDMVTIATGEDSLTSDNSKGGVVTRTIEIFSKPIPDDALAVTLHETLDETYGVVGPEFLRHILAKEEELKKLFKDVKSDLRLIHGDSIGTHLSSVSCVVIADYYMNKLFFNKEDMGDSLHLASTILKQLITKADMDDAQRAYDAFMSWFAANQNSFEDFSKEEFGWINKTPPDFIYVFPTIFKRTMKDLGFNEKRIKQEWAQRGWIKTEKRGNEGKIRFSVREWHEKKRAQLNVVVVRVDCVDY